MFAGLFFSSQRRVWHLLWCLFVVVVVCEGRSLLTKGGKAASIPLTFVNPYESAYEVYWIDDAGEPMLMGNLAAHYGEANVNTYAGHSFGWKKKSEDAAETCASEDLEGRVTVRASTERYVLGEPQPHDDDDEEESLGGASSAKTLFEATFANKSPRPLQLRRPSGEVLIASLGAGEEISTSVKAGDALDWISLENDEELLYRSIVEYHGQAYHPFWDTGHTSLCAEKTKGTAPLSTVTYRLDDQRDVTVDVLRNETGYFVALVHDWSLPADCEEFASKARKTGLSEAQVFGSRTVIADRRAMAANLNWDSKNDSALTNTFIRRAFNFTTHLRGYAIHPGPFQEPLNFIQYGRAEEYRPHCDGVCHRAKYARGGRVATLLHYCRAADVGGATVFPKIGVKVQPKDNDALLFAYKGLDGFMDDGNTQHAGCLVKHGTKQVITMWMREDISPQEPWSDFMS